jgi:hypothetical protein
MKTAAIISIGLAAVSLGAGEAEPYHLTLEPKDPPSIPKVKPRRNASDDKSAEKLREPISKGMMILMRVGRDTQQLGEQFEKLKPEVAGKVWENLTPAQRKAASSAASLSERLRKEVRELSDEIRGFVDPSEAISDLAEAEALIQSYDEFFSMLLHRK